jgi:succinate dehydrogenase / fumarate reductase, membrane anchor subunit
MRYLTDRKRAVGKGAAHRGTEHHWAMTVSAVGLAFLVPAFVYLIGTTLGQDHAGVVATFSRPLPAILTGLVLFVGMRHFAKGATTAIEDYTHGTARKVLIIFVTALSYVIIAVGFYALAKLAL